jgi:hypothetical protein
MYEEVYTCGHKGESSGSAWESGIKRGGDSVDSKRESGRRSRASQDWVLYYNSLIWGLELLREFHNYVVFYESGRERGGERGYTDSKVSTS